MRTPTALCIAAIAACGTETTTDSEATSAVTPTPKPGIYSGLSRYTRDTCALYERGYTSYDSMLWLGNGFSGMTCALDGSGQYVCTSYNEPIGDCAIYATAELTVAPITETSMQLHQTIVVISDICSLWCEIDVMTDLVLTF